MSVVDTLSSAIAKLVGLPADAQGWGSDFLTLLSSLKNASEDLDARVDGKADLVHTHEEGGAGTTLVSRDAASSNVIEIGDDNRATLKTGGGAELAELSAIAAAATLYVAPTGDDANDGLSAGAPKLTLQGAVAAVYAILGGDVEIVVADGTYAGFSLARMTVGGAATPTLTITGNASTPANVVINSTISLAGSVAVAINGATLYPATASYALTVSGSGCSAALSNCACKSTLYAERGGRIEGGAGCTYSVEYDSVSILRADRGGEVTISTATPTLTSSNKATVYGAHATNGGRVFLPASTTITNCTRCVMCANPGSLVSVDGDLSVSLNADGVGIYSLYEGFIFVNGAVAINGGSYTTSFGIQSYYNGRVMTRSGSLTISNVLIGIDIYELSTVGADTGISVSCINGASAGGIRCQLSGRLATAGGVTVTGSGAGIGIKAVQISQITAASFTYAGTWSANTSIATNSVLSTT